MSRISDLQSKIHTLTEIQSIFGAMKNLAIIEIGKVSKFIQAQEKAAKTIADIRFDFEFFYQKNKIQKPKPTQIICLLIGSERGFCGPFNEKILRRFQKSTEEIKDLKLAIIGRKLASKFKDDPRIELFLEGVNSTEEIPGLVSDLSQKLIPYAGFRWMFIHNDGGPLNASDTGYFPLESQTQPQTSKDSDLPLNPPLLNISPQDFYPLLMEQYLYSTLHHALYVSFLAENRERLQHMEGALNQIEKKTTQYSLKMNSFRQENITEELEILLLSTQ